MQRPDPHIIISGGGTGGHIFPALAIARALQERLPGAQILFIGAKGKMEMEKVPAAGFPIEGLWISGLRRDLSPSNLSFPFKVIFSLARAARIIRRFKADVAVGVGGFASGPALRAAGMLGVPTLIMEQNSFPGITNRLLARKVDRICVAYEGMEKYFPAEKITVTGNPVRKEVIDIYGKRDEAAAFFGLKASVKTVLVIGGSQGAFSVNTCIESMLPRLESGGLQLIWQTGKPFLSRAGEALQKSGSRGAVAIDFIQRMDLAYAMADVVISRAGAIAIAELAMVRKAAIFIPLPTAAEDHQMKNAERLARQGAAIVIPDREAPQRLPAVLDELIGNPESIKSMENNIGQFAVAEADRRIAEEVIKLLEP